MQKHFRLKLERRKAMQFIFLLEYYNLWWKFYLSEWNKLRCFWHCPYLSDMIISKWISEQEMRVVLICDLWFQRSFIIILDLLMKNFSNIKVHKQNSCKKVSVREYQFSKYTAKLWRNTGALIYPMYK